MGRVFKPTYTVNGPNGEKIVKETEAFYIEYTDVGGRTRRKKAGLLVTAAKDALKKAENDVLLERNGIPTQRAGDITCAEILKAYVATLKQHVHPRHIQVTEQRINDVLKDCRAFLVKDLTPDAISGVIARLTNSGLATNTVNGYLVSLKAMLNWCVATRRLPFNPIACVKKLSVVKTRKRRALTEDDISRLLAAAMEGPYRRVLRSRQNRPRADGTYKPVKVPKLAEQARLARDGRKNALAYRLMIEVGLRRNEAASVTWRDISLEKGTLTTRPMWEGNKNGKEETLPIAPGLLGALKAWKEETGANDGDVVVKLSDRTLDHLNDDLVEIGLARRVPVDAKGKVIPLGPDGKPITKPAKIVVDKRDVAGHTLDLHALRHTCGTRLVASGADIKTVQALMRHSSPVMTLGIYVHKDKGRMADAVANLPTLRAHDKRNDSAETDAKRTGTDDAKIDFPPSIRQEKSGAHVKTLNAQALELEDAAAGSLKVTGSIPVSSTKNHLSSLPIPM